MKGLRNTTGSTPPRSARRRGPRPARESKSCQGFQQRSGIHEVGHGEAFSERAVYARKRGAGFVAAAEPVPEPREAHRGPKLPCLALLPAGCVEGPSQGLFG